MNKSWHQLFDLRASADYEGTVSSISEGISLKGYNFWLLLCAAMLASIGLDTNSAAIIIGAMLISPLMSPILGVGLSVATNDKSLLLRSCRNLGVAVVASLMASVCYFLLTPFGIPTEELQARTYPTLLDVLVALFGGLAGIISISRKSPSNAIPGVAIATALMPPLCTAGFGIATANWKFFAGAFYLFFINAVFISLATYLVVKYLHFPTLRMENKRLRQSYTSWFALISFIALLPSIYFLFGLYRQEMQRQQIEEQVIAPIKRLGNEILKWEIETQDSVSLIKVYHSGKPINDSLRHRMDSSLVISGLSTFRFQPMRVNLTKEEVSHLSADIARQMFAEMHIRELTERSNPDTLTHYRIWNEIRPLFPSIDSAVVGLLLIPKESATDSICSFTYFAAKPLDSESTERLSLFLKSRTLTDSALISFYKRK